MEWKMNPACALLQRSLYFGVYGKRALSKNKPCSKLYENVFQSFQVGVLKAVSPIHPNHVVLGQYTGSDDGAHDGYRDGKPSFFIHMASFS